MAGLQTYPYRSDHLAIVTYKNHALAKRKEIAFLDTLAFDHITLHASSAVQLMLARAAAASGQTIQSRVEVSTVEAALRVVRSGLGITVVPQEVAQTLVDALDLVIIPLTDAWAKKHSLKRQNY
jgi:DNA-binding transcriptional LysR family regulator